MNLDSSIRDAELSVRATNVLTAAGFKTLRDIPRDPNVLNRYRGLGNRTIREILDLLNDLDPSPEEVARQVEMHQSMLRWESWLNKNARLVRYALDNGMSVSIHIYDEAKP